MKNRILFALSLVTLVGCDRLTMEEKTTVQIKLPSLAPSLSKATNVSTSSYESLTTTGFTGDRPINCFMIAAGGPDEALQRNVCKRKDGSTVFTPRKLGPWVGAAPAGTALGLDVPSGKDRVIYVVGFYAVEGTCRDFKVNGFPKDSESSDPYIVGEAGALELKPGETKEIPIKLSFKEDNRFDTCEGPDFPEHNDGPGSGSGSAPTKIQITKEWFPYNAFSTDTCQSFDLVLKDSNDRQSSFPVAITVAPTVTVSSSPQPLYSSYEECQASSNPQTSFVIPPFESRKQIVFRTPYDPIAAVIGASVTSAPNGVAVIGAGSFPVHDKYSAATDLEGPWGLLPDLCYPFDLVIKKMDNSSYYKYADATVNISNATGVTFYSSFAQCNTSTGSLSSVLFPGSSIKQTLYVKMNQTAGDVTVNFTDAGSTLLPSAKVIHKGYGMNVPKYLEVRGNNKMGGINTCANMAHEVQIVNEYHTPVLLSTATNINLSTNNSGLEYYASYGDCSYPQYPITSVNIPVGGYRAPFYTRYKAFGTHNIIATGTGYTTVSYPIMIDGPAMIEMNPMLPGTLANNQCIGVNVTLKNASGSVAQSSGFSIYPNINGIPGPSTGGFYNDPNCSGYPQTYLNFPYSGPATMQLYFKVDNQSGGPLNVNVMLNANGINSAPASITVNN